METDGVVQVGAASMVCYFPRQGEISTSLCLSLLSMMEYLEKVRHRLKSCMEGITLNISGRLR